jgi:hypothetical protein
MENTSSTEKRQNHIIFVFWCGDFGGKGHLRDLRVHERIILKLIFIYGM